MKKNKRVTKLDAKTAAALRRLQLYRSKFPLFCTYVLKIVTKKRERVPFEWNKAQKYVHERLEAQRELTGGVVRALILKGRQQGISTYVAARFYHRSSMFKFIVVYILSHLDTSAKSLFKIVERYHVHNKLAPTVGTQNKTEMEFPRLESSYTVATAGEGEGGRGKTATLFHGSEVAFWRNADSHFSASVQTIPYEDGTEVILESTANGASGKFYELWQEAVALNGDYIAIFVPWYWQDEYTRPVPANFELLDDGDEDNLSEIEYYEMFAPDGMTMGHMVWRRAKIAEIGRNKFDQEYPGTAEMAFVQSGSGNYLPAIPIMKARKRTRMGAGPLILGVDPAGEGGDRFAITARRGFKVDYVKWRDKLNALEAFNWLKEVILKEKPALVCIDAGGIGAAIITLLRNDDKIPKKIIKSVNFGSPSEFKMARKNSKQKAADIEPGPINRRAEMYMRAKEWLECEEGVDIPDLEVFQSDLTATRIKPTLNNDLQLESKADMKKRGIRSPDLADSFVLTFASLSRITSYEEAAKEDKSTSQFSAIDMPTSGANGNYGWMS